MLRWRWRSLHECTCPACGKPIWPDQPVKFEVLIDPSVRFIRVHEGETTYVRGASDGPLRSRRDAR